MSEHADQTAGDYVKVWGVLLVLFLISVVGPMLEIRWLTIITAFGIAGVKAWLVAVKFMHINVERKFIAYMLGGMLLMCLLFWAGTVVDIGAPSGQNWERTTNIK